MTPANGSPRLSHAHRDELRKSGLTDETIAANGLYTETDPAAVAKLLNWSVNRARDLGLFTPTSTRRAGR